MIHCSTYTLTIFAGCAQVWNSHDGKAVGEMFAADGEIFAFDGTATGAEKCGEMNQGIFTAVPNIKIDIDKCHISESTNTAVW